MRGLLKRGSVEKEGLTSHKTQRSAELQEATRKVTILRSNALQSQGQKRTDHRSLQVYSPSHSVTRLIVAQRQS